MSGILQRRKASSIIVPSPPTAVYPPKRKPSSPPPPSHARLADVVRDYEALDNSELSFRIGDKIEILDIDDNGWAEGTSYPRRMLSINLYLSIHLSFATCESVFVE